MAYDEDLADRIRTAIKDQDGVSEKRMFGGLAFLVNGHLAVSASGQGGLLLRVDRAETDSLVREAGVTRFEMRGRAMDGWVRGDPSGIVSDQELARWVLVGRRVAVSMDHFPLAALTPVDLGRSQRIGTRLPVDRGLGVLVADRGRHVADDVGRDDLMGVRRTAGEPSLQPAEELVDLGASDYALPGTEDGHWFVAGPDLTARGGVTVVHGGRTRTVTARSRPHQRAFPPVL